MGRESLTTEEFISRANKKHNYFYNYNKVKYIRSNKEVTITCPIHGDFEQSPNSHLKGQRCKTCYYDILTKTQENFIIESNKKHNNFYNYNKVKYVHSQTKVTINCPIHGDFDQIPASHLNGNGCKKCSDKNQTITIEEFVIKVNKKHNNFYNYAKVNYINNRTKVIITCPIHGDFKQTPSNHITGKGCPKCKKSPLSKDSKDGHGILYLLLFQNSKEKFIKIGITNNIINRKYGFLKQYLVTELELYHGSYKKMHEYEHELKNKFYSHSYTPKYKFYGYTECFNVDILENVKLEILKLFSN